MLNFVYGVLATWFVLGLGYSFWWGDNNLYTLLMELPGGIIGIIVGTIQMKKAMNAEESGEEQPFYFPFGPSIALSAVLLLFFGNIILDWYLSLF